MWFVKFKQITLNRFQEWVNRWDEDVMRTFGEHLKEELDDPAVKNLQDIVAKMHEIRERMTDEEHTGYFLWSTELSYHEKANLYMFIVDIEQTYSKLKRDALS